MKFEVTMDRGLFILKIDNEKILENQKLSIIVNKIEDYLKIRYLPEREKKGVDKFFDNLSG
jgi:hypothetical protein